MGLLLLLVWAIAQPVKTLAADLGRTDRERPRDHRDPLLHQRPSHRPPPALLRRSVEQFHRNLLEQQQTGLCHTHLLR